MASLGSPTDRSTTGDGPAPPPARPAPWLAATAIAYALLHHVGSGFAWLGPVGSGSTRWADWIDLATPYAFLLPAALALWRAGGVAGSAWLVYLLRDHPTTIRTRR
jgi:hypothetical protein